MRVLVTGGNGELGRRVVRRLLRAGHDVDVGTRSPHRRGDAASELAFDLAVPATVDAAVDRAEVVIHLASDPTAPRIDVAGMETLVDAAERAGLRHLVYVSIVGIDDHAFPYYRAKLASEQLLTASAVPWTILRTTQFHGLPLRFSEALGAGPVGVAVSGVPFQPLDPDAVADRVVEVVADGPSGRVPDLGGPEVLDLGDAMRRSRTAAGLRRLLIPLRLPKRMGGDAFRRGDLLLAPDGVVAGGRTFAEYLDEVAAERAARQAATSPGTGRDRVGTTLRLVGWALLLTALWMVVAPQGFVDGIAGFGEVADHFIRDLATFTAPLGVALLLAAARPRWRRPVLGVALLQNGLHVVNHLVDIGTTDPSWHGPVNAAALMALQVVLWLAFRASDGGVATERRQRVSTDAADVGSATSSPSSAPMAPTVAPTGSTGHAGADEPDRRDGGSSS